MMKGTFGFICNSNYCLATPLTAGLLVVGGLGIYDFFKTKNTSYTKRKWLPEKELNFSRKDLNEMKERVETWPS
nr:hypothetical protein [Mycoplasmopsis bovis]